MKIYTINEIFDEIFDELEKGRGKDKVKRKARRFKVGGGGLAEDESFKGKARKPRKGETGVESFPKQFPGVLYRRGSVL